MQAELSEEKRHGHSESKNKTDTNSLRRWRTPGLERHKKQRKANWARKSTGVRIAYTHAAYVHYSNSPPPSPHLIVQWSFWAGDRNELRKKEKKAAPVRAFSMVEEKRYGKIKGRTVADGRPQWKIYTNEETSSPTVSTDGWWYQY